MPRRVKDGVGWVLTLQPLHKAVRIGWPLLQEQVAEHTAAALPKFVVKGFEA